MTSDDLGARSQGCVFCGFPQTSNEHVLPQWMAGLFPTESAWGYGNLRRPSIRRHRLFTDEVNAVCQHNCNGGWMSRLEVAARPLLVPVIRDQPCDLGPADQAVVARWAVKTALMASFLRPKLPIAQHHFDRVYRGMPDDGTIVWLARYTNPTFAAGFRLRPVPINWGHRPLFIGTEVANAPPSGALADGYYFVVNVGAMLLVVLSVVFPPDDTATAQVELDAGSDAMAVLWPHVSDIVRCPLTADATFDRVGLSALANSDITLRLR